MAFFKGAEVLQLGIFPFLEIKCLCFFNLLGLVYVLIVEILMSKNMHAAVIFLCVNVCIQRLILEKSLINSYS